MAGGGGESRVFIRGVGEPLPPGERILWEGKPEYRSLLREAFHVRAVLIYFLVLALIPAYLAWGGAAQAGIPVLARVAWLAVLGGTLVGMAALLCWLTVRTTVYALTDRRIVLRIGIGLPAIINIPLEKVGGLWQRVHKDGTGDIALTPRETRSIGYLLLWPHARPWKVRSPEPMLRSIPDVARVGALFRDAVVASGALERPEGRPTPVAWDLTGEADDPCGGHQPPPPTPRRGLAAARRSESPA